MELQVQRFLCSRYFIFTSIALSFWLGLGWVPLFDLDEGAFTEATREMLSSGVYSATYLDGEPRYDKPIFFYWIQALSISTLGFNEWAFRLPSVIAACLWAWAVYRFVDEFYNDTRARIAALFLVNTIIVAFIARAAIADALLNLFLSLTLFDIWRYINTKREPYVLRLYLWMALGTLTKGPVAVAVPLLVSFLYLISRRELVQYYRCYFNWKGWSIYLALVSPWLIFVFLEQGSGFFHGFIVEHNLKRFSDTRESHGGSIFYYIGILPLILLPISGLLFYVLKSAKSIALSQLERFLALWFLTIFILFSFSKTQLPHYILNGCVPLIILMATIPKLEKHARWTPIFAIFFASIFLFLPEILGVAAANSDGYDAAALALYTDAIPEHYRIYAILLVTAILVISFIPKLLTWQRLAILGCLLNTFVFTQVVHIASQLQQAPIHHAIRFLENNYPETPVVAYRMHMPTFSVYRHKITPLRAPVAGEIALVRVDRIKRLENLLTDQKHVHERIFRSGALALVRVHPLEHTASTSTSE